MTDLPRLTVAKTITDIGLIPVFHHGDIEVAKAIVRACFDGGARVVEYTNRGNRASDVFSELARWRDDELPRCILGAGTIMDPETAASYINGGADYIVAPTFNPETALTCNRRKVLYIPGCQTPTEITEAESLGADIIKLFPASVATPKFIKAVHGPMPHTKLMPSGGVKYDRGGIAEWIKAGAVALNMGSDLIRKNLVEEGRYAEIQDRVRQCLAWIGEARKE
jgi:2-dehydro-3-deoxyphosphogluconate aldolase/(4S)-4-hydroxy-2-oxoglutarate aldolase